MRILADENCGWTLIAALGAAGHDVKSIARAQPGSEDEAVFGLARNEGRVLLTYDRGFGRMAERARDRPPAILLMRLRDLPSRMHARIAVEAIAGLGEKAIGQFSVIEPHQVRSRPYKD